MAFIMSAESHAEIVCGKRLARRKIRTAKVKFVESDSIHMCRLASICCMCDLSTYLAYLIVIYHQV